MNNYDNFIQYNLGDMGLKSLPSNRKLFDYWSILTVGA